jgi:hypothetical protein
VDLRNASYLRIHQPGARHEEIQRLQTASLEGSAALPAAFIWVDVLQRVGQTLRAGGEPLTREAQPSPEPVESAAPKACADCRPAYGDCLNAGCFLAFKPKKPSESAEPLKADPWEALDIAISTADDRHNRHELRLCVAAVRSEVDAAHAADTATIADLRAEVEKSNKHEANAWLEVESLRAALTTARQALEGLKAGLRQQINRRWVKVEDLAALLDPDLTK